VTGGSPCFIPAIPATRPLRTELFQGPAFPKLDGEGYLKVRGAPRPRKPNLDRWFSAAPVDVVATHTYRPGESNLPAGTGCLPAASWNARSVFFSPLLPLAPSPRTREEGRARPERPPPPETPIPPPPPPQVKDPPPDCPGTLNPMWEPDRFPFDPRTVPQELTKPPRPVPLCGHFPWAAWWLRFPRSPP